MIHVTLSNLDGEILHEQRFHGWSDASKWSDDMFEQHDDVRLRVSQLTKGTGDEHRTS